MIKKWTPNTTKLIKEFAEEYTREHGTDRDKEILESLFAKAREGNDHQAIVELARRYFEGDGIEQNYVEAMYWIYQAEALGNPNAPALRKSIEKKASTIQVKAAQKKLSEEIKEIVVVKDEKIDLIKVKDYLFKKFK